MLPDSEAAPDRSRWMTLLEALAHIQSVEKCQSLAAQVALKTEIGNCLIQVKWANAKGSEDRPNISTLRRSQFVLSSPGLAPSGHALPPLCGSALRPLLLLRSAVEATWPRTGSITAQNSTARNEQASQDFQDIFMEWMSLVEATDHIRLSENCDSIEALRQLKCEAFDGTVRVRWEDAERAADRPDPEILRGSQLLLIGTGLAPDIIREEYRPLLIQRNDVRRCWQLPNRPTEDFDRSRSVTDQLNYNAKEYEAVLAPKNEDETGTTQIDSHKKLGRPSARSTIRNTLSQMRNEHYSLKQTQTALATEILRRNNKEFGDAGWSERAVKAHVSAWLKENGITPSHSD